MMMISRLANPIVHHIDLKHWQKKAFCICRNKSCTSRDKEGYTSTRKLVPVDSLELCVFIDSCCYYGLGVEVDNTLDKFIFESRNFDRANFELVTIIFLAQFVVVMTKHYIPIDDV